MEKDEHGLRWWLILIVLLTLKTITNQSNKMNGYHHGYLALLFEETKNKINLPVKMKKKKLVYLC